jgi:hypothetical protein
VASPIPREHHQGFTFALFGDLHRFQTVSVDMLLYAVPHQFPQLQGRKRVQLAAIANKILGVPVALAFRRSRRQPPSCDLFRSDGNTLEVDLGVWREGPESAFDMRSGNAAGWVTIAELIDECRLFLRRYCFRCFL